MTDQTPQPTTDPEAQRRAELAAECAKRGIKTDKRFSTKRMEDLIAEHDGKPPETAAATVPTEDVEALKARLAAAEAALAEKAKAPEPKPYNVPAGTLTSQQMAGGEDELAAAWRRATELGIAGALPKGASIDQIMKRITDHLAAKAQEQMILEEQARRQAAMPQQRTVTVRVLPHGDGKVGKGIHLPGIGNSYYKRGETFALPLDIATNQQNNGYVEIMDAVA